MMSYRIKELRYEDDRVEFIPQYKENFVRLVNDVLVTDKNENWVNMRNEPMNTKEWALDVIKSDRQKRMKPIDEIIHEVNF